MTNTQLSLFAAPTELPDQGETRYQIEVKGTAMYADFNPSYFAGAMHISFRSMQDGVSNPLSHTGYLSHFIFGTVDDIPGKDIRNFLIDVANANLEQKPH